MINIKHLILLLTDYFQILSKDSVTVNVDAVVYFRVCDATVSIVNVENATGSTKLLAQTTLRNVLGTKTLSEMLSHREEISNEMQQTLDQATESWGVKVERVEVKDIRLPVNLQRAMAAEAEANREAKAKVIAADGERLASESLRTAATVLSETPAALQLRYLQTLNTISAEHNSTIIFPLPMDLLGAFMNYRPQPQAPQQQPSGTEIFSMLQNQPPTYDVANSPRGEQPSSSSVNYRSVHSRHGRPDQTTSSSAAEDAAFVA